MNRPQIRGPLPTGAWRRQSSEACTHSRYGNPLCHQNIGGSPDFKGGVCRSPQSALGSSGEPKAQGTPSFARCCVLPAAHWLSCFAVCAAGMRRSGWVQGSPRAGAPSPGKRWRSGFLVGEAYPRLLWATLWIKSLTTLQHRASSGPATRCSEIDQPCIKCQSRDGESGICN